MRGLFMIVLVMQLIFPNWALAAYDPSWEPKAKDTDVFVDSFNKFAVSPKSAGLAMRGMKAGASNGAHVAQTIMMLWILAGIEATHQQHKMQPLTGKEVSIPEIVGNTGSMLLNSWDMYAGMLGASVTGVGLKKPLADLTQLIHSNVSNKAMAGLLNSGAVSFVTFVGWEAGAQLWTEAIHALSGQEDSIAAGKDIEIAKKLKFGKILALQGTPQENAVFGKIILNALQIFTVYKPDLAASWIYNTWRLRLGTGEFFTMLSSMVVAGVTMGSIAPGAGWGIGLFFGFTGGLIGGVAAVFLPRSFKQPITDGIRAVRVNANSSKKHVQIQELVRIYGYYNKPYGQPMSPEHQEKEVAGYLKRRYLITNDELTPYIEQIYESYVRLEEAEGLQLKLEEFKTNPNAITKQVPVAIISYEGADAFNQGEPAELRPATPAEIEQLTAEAAQIKKTESERIAYYFKLAFGKIKKEYELFAYWAYSPESKFSPQIKAQMKKYLEDQEVIYKEFKHLNLGLQPERKAELGFEDLSKGHELAVLMGAQAFVNFFYLRGVNVQDLLASPTLIKLKCYPHWILPYLTVRSSVGWIRLDRTEEGYSAQMQVSVGPNAGTWIDGTNRIESDKQDFDALAKLLGKPVKECERVEKEINKRITEAFEATGEASALEGAAEILR